MRKKISMLLVVLLAVAGCTMKPDVIKLPYQEYTDKYQPINNTSNETGIVRYFVSGGTVEQEKRKENAYKFMHQNCNGKYEITRTDHRERVDSSVVLNSGGLLGLFVPLESKVVYVYFKCIEPS
jgi:hypothetical protein